MTRSGIGNSSPRPGGVQRTFTKLLILPIFGFILIQKLVVVWQIHLAPSVDPWSGLDTTAYVELALRVISGDWGLGPGLYYVSPFYIYFLALVVGVTKSFTAIRVVQALLGTVAIGFMFETARQWFGPRAALGTAILAAVTGLFTFYEALILQTGVDVFLTSAALLCLTFALKKAQGCWTWEAGRWTLAAGAVFGVQTMNRPNIAIAIVLMVILLAALRKWKFAVALAAGLLIGISPAAIRNAVVANEFSLLSSHGGLNFYLGNGEGATGFYRFIPGITPTIKGQANDVRVVAGHALGRTVTDAEASDYFMDLTWRWIGSHPASAAFLMVRKFGWVFHAQHVPLPYSYPFYQTEWPTLLRYLFIGPWLLVPFGLVGLWFAKPDASQKQFLIWASFVPAYAAAVALFFMSERYRLPLLVPLTIGAGAAVDLFLTYIKEKNWRRLAAPAAVAAIFLVLVNTRAMANDGTWEEGLRLAAQLVLQGKFDESDRWIEKLEAKTTRPGNASGSIGLQLLLKNEPARALRHLENAAALDPNKSAIEYALGQALLGVGRADDAIPHLRFGFENGATLPMTGYHLAAALRDVGRIDEARALLPRVKMTTESRVEDWMTVGRLGMEMKSPELAAPYLQKAVELAPANAEARLQFGVSLVVMKRFDDAARELTEAARLDPKSAPALAYLAYAEQQLGRLDAARLHLGAALAIDPNDPMARLLAGK